MKSLLLITSVFLGFTFYGLAQDSQDLDQLLEWMTGEFDSSAQEASDSSYYNITLKTVRIWPDSPNGGWLYVEQAVADSPDEPYRQRVYFVSAINDDTFSSDIYTLPNEEEYVGAWKDPSKFSGLKPFDLKYKEGCTVYLNYDGFQYTGKTNDESCKSEMRGASYATSEVTLLPEQLNSWDRGFDASGKQVWGAEKGAYQFKRK